MANAWKALTRKGPVGSSPTTSAIFIQNFCCEVRTSSLLSKKRLALSHLNSIYNNFMLAKIRLLLLLFCATLFFPATVLAAEEIRLFDSKMTVSQDTSLRITETIHYTTDEDKHGIFRYIPFRYNRSGLNYTAKISQISVTDEAGEPLRYEQSIRDGNLVLKIGDPNTTFTGDQIYRITYVVENALQKPDNLPELYWDITGEGWTIPITATSVTVDSPFARITRVTCYSGTFGTNDELCNSSNTENQATLRYDQTINYGDNFTIAVGLDPQGGLVFPTPLQKWLRQIRDNISLFFLPLPALIMGLWWWKKGRDWSFLTWNVFNHDDSRPQTRSLPWLRQAPFVYEPLKELTPGETGALLDERVDNRDIIAEIIDLARQKYLSIKRQDTKKLLHTETDYIFHRLRADFSDLPDHQQYLLEKLFEGGKTAKLSELKGTFYPHMEKVRGKIFTSLFTKKLFEKHPQNQRVKAFVVAIALDILFGFKLIQLLEQEIWWAVPIYLVSGAAALLFAYFLPAKTAKGTNLALQARGLRRTIQRGAWREKIAEKHLFFQEVLPFALALGVVDRLTKDMEALHVQAPTYIPASAARGWSTGSFVDSFSTQAASGLSFNPNSSSSSGSGFSGGSSGGGGGGGGGGSW